MARKKKQRRIYRDYRKGHEGKFASEETFNRSQAQGVICHIHEERVPVVKEEIDSIEELFDMEDRADLIEYEYHGTGDTGRRKK